MSDADRIASLRRLLTEAQNEVAELEAKVTGLQTLLRVSLGFPPGWNLTPGEERLLSLLARRGDMGATHDAVAYVVSSNAEQMAKPNTVRDTIVSLRRKVLGRGITIDNLYGRGYAITGDSLTAARSGWAVSRADLLALDGEK